MSSDLVLRFLNSIGRPSEAEFYVKLFRAQRRESFAVLVVSDTVVREALDAVVADLGFLADLGLRPVVVVGVVNTDNARVSARSLSSRLGQVPAHICHPDDVLSVVSRGGLAIVPFERGIGETIDERFSLLASLVARLGSEKLIFLGRRSGLQLRGGQVPSLVNLTLDYERMHRTGALVKNQRMLLAQIQRVFAEVPHHLTVAITSPLDLLRELFTVKGAGTLVRRGAEITGHDDLNHIDKDRLTALIERAFERPPALDLLERPITKVFLEKHYRGAAIIGPAPMAKYLSKFAVDVGARGEGVGSDLWRAITDYSDSLLWRSRPDNPINAWYTQVCDGLDKSGDWYVFWRGISPESIPSAIRHARSAPVDFR